MAVDFWNDHWMGDASIAEHMGIEKFSKVEKVNDFWINGRWNALKVRENCGDLFLDILNIPIGINYKDKLRVKGKTNGRTTTSIIHRKQWNWDNAKIWGKFIWSNNFRPSMAIFNWRVLHRLLPTDDILKMKGIPTTSKCYLCKNGEDNLEHVPLHCSFAIEIRKIMGLNLC